jgi:hypothetical protein
MSWLNEIVNQHEELESPKSFWYWSAIAAISAVVKDSVWIPRGGVFNTYPNIYVMLHAESGMKKGPPVAMAKQLVKAVNNTRIISGRASIQGILKELGTGQTVPGGKVNLKSVAFICSSELSSSIVEDKVATKILTDLYDRSYNEGEWKSLLKMENFQLKDPTVTMLTATNEAMSEDFFTKSAIQGGYFARTFIIHESKRQTVNSLVYPLGNPPNYVLSSNYLKQLSTLNGPFSPLAQITEDEDCKFRRVRQGREIWFSAVGLRYDEWYQDFVDRVSQLESHDETGTLNRFGDSVLKVAMLLSLAEEPILRLSLTAMDTAINECEKLLGNVRRTTLGKYGISASATLKNMVIMELYNRDNHQVSRTILMKKMWMHYQEASEFDEIMLSFNENGMILTSSVGNQILYTMPDTQVKDLHEFMSGKNKKKNDKS